MISDYDTLIDAALALPLEGRADLAEKLAESLDETRVPSVSQAWLEEIRNRVAAYRRGEMKTVPAKEVFDSLRSGTSDAS